MQINIGKKSKICQICGMKVKKPNSFVKYHVSYEPEYVIKACSFCNYAEYLLRNEIVENTPFRNREHALLRFMKVIHFSNQFGITYNYPFTWNLVKK